MTYEEANRLVLMLSMNYATFIPPSPEAAAAKKGMWVEVLKPYDYKAGLKATKDLMATMPYPPTIADINKFLGVDGELTRDDVMARLPGPTIEDTDARYASYERQSDRIDALMAELDRELARTNTFDTGGKNARVAGRKDSTGSVR